MFIIKINYNWSGYRTLREDAMPSVFPFATKKTMSGRQLVWSGLKGSGAEDRTTSISEDQSVSVD